MKILIALTHGVLVWASYCHESMEKDLKVRDERESKIVVASEKALEKGGQHD